METSTPPRPTGTRPAGLKPAIDPFHSATSVADGEPAAALADGAASTLPQSAPADLGSLAGEFIEEAPPAAVHTPTQNESSTASAGISAADDIAAAHDASEAAVHEREDAARSKVKALAERTKATRPNSDDDLLMRAYSFASEKHAPQRRMTGEPYIEHPIAVAGILAELGMDDTTIAAGFLHDVQEDCGVTYQEMAHRFGAEVAQLVDGVTKLKHIEFSTREEKQAENLRKLFLAMAGDVRVIIVKLADRLHNMRTLDPHTETHRKEIAAETLHIFAPIAHRLGIWRLKWELEDRSFKYLEPEVYKQIYALVQHTRAERSDMVQTAIERLEARLKDEGIKAEVNGRPKHFYSIYQKMIKQGLKFDKIHDLIALRIVCDSVLDCYSALGIVHSLWMQVPEMFFDYIAKPKPNNYRSLHTKVMGTSGDVIEVQIRTREMHREAEFGIAAHWRYKNDDQPRQNFGGKFDWMRLVLELQSDTENDASGFLESLKLDLSSEQIFAFTPKGEVIDLRSGATPVDFAYRVHSAVGNNCVGAKVNGRIVPLSYHLHNGDICEILTSRTGGGPKRGWLDFVATRHARDRIKSQLKKQNFDDNHREGLQRLEKAAQVQRLKLGSIADNESLLKQAKLLKHRTVDELVAAIGYGEHSAETVLKRVQDDLAQAAQEAAPDDQLSGVAAALLHRKVKPRVADEPGSDTLRFSLPLVEPDATSGSKPKLVNAQGDLLYTLAKCCAPIPGDEVRGYVTRGRGVSVHRADCSNLKQYEAREPNRLIAAHWEEKQEQLHCALIALESGDRMGLLHEVTSVIVGQRININAVNSYPLKNNRARLNIAVRIADVEQLTDLMNALRGITGVTEVHRV